VRHFSRGVALALLGSGLVVSTDVCAAPPTGASAETAPAEEPDEPESPEPRFFVALDSVFGVGKWTVLNTPGTAPVPSSPFTALSLLPGASFKITNDFAVSARLPVTIARFSPTGYDARTTAALGNLEVGASFTWHAFDEAPLVFGLDVALPTAQGSAGASTSYSYYGPSPTVSTADFDRYAANASASALRGWESIAIFEDNSVGISPRVFMPWRPLPRLFLGPWVKLENLIFTNGGSNIYGADVVAGVRADYLVLDALDVGARFWINAPLTNEEQTEVTAVIEPELRLHVGLFTALVSVIVPLAGPTTIMDPRIVGTRLALMDRF
jgi:hypothetical protein